MTHNRTAIAGSATVATVYFGYFAALASSGPFLTLYLGQHGFPRDAATFAIAALPITRVLATPAWTLLSDRLRSASAVLRIVTIGAFVCFASLEWRLPPVALIAALVAFTAFRSPVTALVDVLALESTARSGTDFGRLRAWGTVGFLVGMLVCGRLLDRFGTEVIAHQSVVLLAATLAAAMLLPRAAPPTPVRLLPAVSALVRRPRFVRFIVTASLHQVGLASYDVLFGAHLTGLASATYAGVAIAFGAAAEVLCMTWGRRPMRRIGLGHTLVIAYVVSAVRWLLIAWVHDARALVLIQALHAFTFGAFYLAGVALVDEESPPEIRASGQGIFGAVTWGIASAAALALAGWLQRLGGIRLVFLVAAGASAVSAWLAVGLGGSRRA